MKLIHKVPNRILSRGCVTLLLCTFVGLFTGLLLHAELAVSDVQVFSGKPWREVAIGYTISGTTSEPRMLQVQARDNTTGTTYDCTTLTDANVEPGRHVMKWNAQADGVKVCSSNVVMTVQIVPPPLYCVIDLSGGVEAVSYPVTRLEDAPSGGWTDEYKTSKLVLRRIEAGTFTMGSLSSEVGHQDNEVQHQVTLTKPFYIGVFEVTQRQWELVMGTKPSYFNNATYYATRPVEKVSYNMIRGSSTGAGWPANNAVDATSFLGKLRAKTGLDFDLPTEAQWEYACRAGTTTALNSGKNLTSTGQDSNMTAVGRYYYNSSASSSSQASWTTSQGTAKVGSYAPNAWGLYDMHGNVWELCLDWYGTLSSSAATDPAGSSSGSSRVIRGGSWGNYADGCRSAIRFNYYPSSENRNYGFRLVRTP